MRLHKFQTVDAFVALDLAGADAGSGPVRWARKVLQGGAKDLARSHTYTYAALQMRRSGASAGISAEALQRAEAVAAFVAEASGLVLDGTYLPDAAKGVDEADLAPLREADPRTVSRLGAFAAQCDGLSAAVAADTAVGLDGRTAIIEGFSATGPALAEAVTQRGGRIVGVATAEGSLVNRGGFDPAALAEAWSAHGDKMLSALAGRDRGPGSTGGDTLGSASGDRVPGSAGGDHPGPGSASGDRGPGSTGGGGGLGDGLDVPGAVWSVGADVVFAGSRMGIVDHGVAERLGCLALVPSGRLAYTSKALAVCRRGGVVAVPDFVALAGSTVAAWSDSDTGDDEVRDGIASIVSTLMAEALESGDGPFLGACYAAEAFLATWQDEPPFGRPLAS